MSSVFFLTGSSRGLGRIDVDVNNAGYADLAAVEDVTLEDFRRQIETNLFGVVNVTKAALQVLRGQGTGHIIQVSSIGWRPPGCRPTSRPNGRSAASRARSPPRSTRWGFA
jgi:NAD(P)-dependent dehydrogenase (short-subunit alcohol dehydrogenase family)